MHPSSSKPTVIIIGRPNVGKSTLFNRLVGKRLALVDDQPGVTRDRRFGDATIAGLDFQIVDTAGWEDDDPDTLPGRMRKQTEVSLEGADAALFVFDSRVGLTPLDEEIARWLRGQRVPVVLVANKAEGSQGDAGNGYLQHQTRQVIDQHQIAATTQWRYRDIFQAGPFQCFEQVFAGVDMAEKLRRGRQGQRIVGLQRNGGLNIEH